MYPALDQGAPRILCISPLFPPAADAEAFCAGKLVLALRDAGCEIEVLYSGNFCPGARQDDSGLWKSLSSCSHDVPIPAAASAWKSLGDAMQFGTLLLPRWVSAAVSMAAQLHRQKQFDLVYSRSLPMIAHVAGYHAARELQLPWVANLNDPWDFHFFPGSGFRDKLRIDRLLSGSWLRKTQKSASLVTYCSAWLRDFHTRITGLDHPTAVLPHIGWRAPLEEPKHPAGGLHLVHAGKLGANEFTGRSATTLLEGVRGFTAAHAGEKLNFSLTLVGPQDLETERLILHMNLKPFVQTIGPVSYEESLKWIASATVAVLVEAELKTGIFFASKLADYLAAGKPILAFSPSHGVVADLAAQGRGVVRIGNRNSRAVAELLEVLYQASQKGNLEEYTPAEKLRKTCTAEQVAARFLAILRNRNIVATTTRWQPTSPDPMLPDTPLDDPTIRYAAADPRSPANSRYG